MGAPIADIVMSIVTRDDLLSRQLLDFSFR